MFTPAERDALRAALLDRARADPHVVTAAVTGSLACLRLGLSPWFARGADDLPLELTETLPRSTDSAELTRALTATRELYLEEVREHDEQLAERIRSAT